MEPASSGAPVIKQPTTRVSGKFFSFSSSVSFQALSASSPASSSRAPLTKTRLPLLFLFQAPHQNTEAGFTRCFCFFFLSFNEGCYIIFQVNFFILLYFPYLSYILWQYSLMIHTTFSLHFPRQAGVSSRSPAPGEAASKLLPYILLALSCEI